MYPNLYFFLKSVFGIEIEALKLVNTFGFMVALAFVAGAWALSTELKRRQDRGWLQYTEHEIWVGKGADWSEVFWNGFFGFVLGWKFLGLLFNKTEALADPQAYLLSGQGNILLGLLLGGSLAGLKWYQGNKTKLANPEKRKIRIWPHDRVGDMIVLAGVLGFGGAKLFHNLENFEDLLSDPIGALTSFSGLTFYGGLICAGIGILWYAKKRNINLWHLVDSFGPAMMLAYAVGRIGCQVAGDGDWGIVNSAYVADEQGKAVLATPGSFEKNAANYLDFYKRAQHNVKEVVTPADILHRPTVAPSFLPTWMVAYTYPNNVLSEGVALPDCEGQWCARLPMPVYPTPFYETVIGLILFGVLWILRKRIVAPGVLFGIYLIFNGLERFSIEKIRINTTSNFLGMQLSQAEIISFCLMVAGIIIVLMRKNKKAA